MKKGKKILGLLTFLLAFTFGYGQNIHFSKVYYVSTAGLSTGNGSTQATAVTFPRLLTLSSTFTGGEKVFLKAGDTYYGDLTIKSGTYVGKYGSGPKPSIRGTILSNTLTWTQNGVIWSAPVASRVTRVFLNNSPQRIAQSAYFTITSKPSSTSITSTGATGLGVWVTNAEMVGKEFSFRWFYNTITAYNTTTGNFTLDVGGNGSIVNNQFKLINEQNLITTDGDWAWETGTVYYRSPGNVNPNTLNVELSVYNEGIFAASNTSNVTIEGINFFGQALDGVYMDSASDITIRDCQFKNQFNAGVALLGHTSRATIVNTIVDSVCNNGISFNELFDSYLSGDTITNIGVQVDPLLVRDNSSTVISGNRYRFPINKQLGIGVSCYPNSSRNLIENSLTAYTSYGGFEFCSNYSTIRNCQAHDYTLRQNDGGGIYVYADSVALFPSIGWKNIYGLNVLNNYCYNGWGLNEGGAAEQNKGIGIYMDNGARSSKIYGNTVRNNNTAGIFLNWNVQGIDMNGNSFYNNPYGIWINDDTAQDHIQITSISVNNNTFTQVDSSHGFQYGMYIFSSQTPYNPFLNGGSFKNNIFITPYSNIVLFSNGAKTLASAQTLFTQPVGFNDPVRELFVDSVTGVLHYPIDINNTLSTRKSVVPLGYRTPMYNNQNYTLGPNESVTSILGTLNVPGTNNFIPIFGDSGRLKPSMISQSAITGNITLNIPGQLALSGPIGGFDLTRHDNGTDVWKLYSAAGEFTFHDNIRGDRVIIGATNNTISTIFFPSATVSFPAAFVADGGGRGPIIMGSAGTLTNFSTYGIQFGVGAASSGMNAYSNINAGTPYLMTLQSGTGNVGIGTVTDSAARLHLIAGSTTVAPLKFTAGTLTTTPKAGFVEYNGLLWLTDQNLFRDSIARAAYIRNTYVNIAAPILGSSSTVGYVWTATNTAGAGSWQTLGSSTNIYNSDGTLTGTRSLLGASNILNLGTSGSKLAGLNVNSTGALQMIGGQYNNSNGAEILGQASTINNPITAASGTVANFSAYAFLAPTVTSTNTAVTYTTPSTLYINDAPTMSTNSSASVVYSLNVAAGRSHFGVGTSSYSAQFDGGISLGGASYTNAAVINLPASTVGQVALIIPEGTTPSPVIAGGIYSSSTDHDLHYSPSSIGNDYVLLRALKGSATLDFPSTAAGASSDLTITVTGALDGDVISVGVPNGSTLSDGMFTAWCSATNTVTVRFSNNNLVTSLDPASGTFKVSVIK